MTAAHPTRTAVPPDTDIHDERHPPAASPAQFADMKTDPALLRSLENAATRTAVPAAEDGEKAARIALADMHHFDQIVEYVATLRARVAELAGVIAEHNKRCERECDSRLFGSLPRRYLIEVPK